MGRGQRGRHRRAPRRPSGPATFGTPAQEPAAKDDAVGGDYEVVRFLISGAAGASGFHAALESPGTIRGVVW
jgi:hypothetical protein